MDSPDAPDVETSSPAYAQRFAGSVGQWFLDVQAGITLDLLRPWPGASVLEVGGGHGQLTGPLLEGGYRVTVYGSPGACGEAVGALSAAGRTEFHSGDLHRLPWPDQAFDLALTYRLLTHLERWRDTLGEMCRVARRAVVVDYPTRRSLNALSAALFGLKKGLEGDTRPFQVFSEAGIASAFGAHGFRVAARRPQFLWPMALHRGLGRAGLSRALERVPRAMGLTAALGSPVIVRAERDG